MKSKNIKNKRPNKIQGVEDKLQDLMDLESPTCILLYGRPGTGKTTIASTAPKPLLLIDVKDLGTESAKREDVQRGDITIYQMEEFDDIYKIYDYIKENPTRFKSVVIDHWTALQELCHNKVMKEEGKVNMSQQMFGFSSSYLKEIIGLFKDLTSLNINPIFICQDRLESGEGDGEDQLIPEVGPALMPSISRLICASSRVIGHTYLQEKVEKLSDAKISRSIEYRLRLGPNPYYITKVTRPFGSPCPPYLVDATYQDIISIVKGEWTPKPEHGKIKKKARRIPRK